jgi:hypothetical protein
MDGFAAQLTDSISTTSIIRYPYLKPPHYKLPVVVILNVSLVQYFHVINGWQDWTRETALSGRYVYAFGELYDHFREDGWIKDTATGEILNLIDPTPMALSE